MSGGAETVALDLDLSGLRLRVTGLGPALSGRLADEWKGFVVPRAGEPFLCVAVGYSGADAELGEFLPKKMSSTLTAHEARFWMPEGSAVIDGEGRAELRLAPALGEREYYTLANLLRACLAWRLPSRGGMLLHAAGLIVDKRAFLLVGSQDSGKSTWARLGEQGGARVLSDDLVVVDGAGERLEALGSPLRSSHDTVCGPGRWPLAGILFPVHGERPALQPVGALLASARLAANLPFIAEGLDRDRRIAGALDRVVAEIGCAELTFALEPSFLELLRSWPA